MKLPAVSVVFVSYKQERYVKEALLGALNQDLPSYELIIADDASPDGTVAVIESVLAANPGRTSPSSSSSTRRTSGS